MKRVREKTRGREDGWGGKATRGGNRKGSETGGRKGKRYRRRKKKAREGKSREANLRCVHGVEPRNRRASTHKMPEQTPMA